MKGTELGLSSSNILGQRIEERETTLSTQVDARSLLEEGAQHGTLVWARAQSAGRGRGGRAWLAPERGLYCSLVLRPRATPLAQAPRLTSLACVGLVDGLLNLGLSPRVKWPNDIVFASDRSGPLGPFLKAAGILVELVLDAPGSAPGQWSAILGFGINLSAPAGGWPPDLADRATDLSEQGFAGTEADCLRSILEGLEDWLAVDATEQRFEAALGRLRGCSATLGREVKIPEEEIVGKAVDLDPEGALLVDTATGQRRIVAGDVWEADPPEGPA